MQPLVAQGSMGGYPPVERKQVVGREPGAQLPRRPPCPRQHGQDEALRLYQVRAGFKQPCTLAQRFEDQAHIAVLQVAQSAMDQLGRTPGCPETKVIGFEERHPQSSRGRLLGNSAAVDSAADDRQVQGWPGSQLV